MSPAEIRTRKPQQPQTHASDRAATNTIYFYFGATAPPPVGHAQLIHDDAPQSVGLLWMSDQLVARDLYLYNTQH